MPDGDKDGEDCQLLDIPEFLDRRSEANQASVSKKESKRSP
jgi:hypothetical protein